MHGQCDTTGISLFSSHQDQLTQSILFKSFVSVSRSECCAKLQIWAFVCLSCTCFFHRTQVQYGHIRNMSRRFITSCSRIIAVNAEASFISQQKSRVYCTRQKQVPEKVVIGSCILHVVMNKGLIGMKEQDTCYSVQ